MPSRALSLACCVTLGRTLDVSGLFIHFISQPVNSFDAVEALFRFFFFNLCACVSVCHTCTRALKARRGVLVLVLEFHGR